MATQVGQGPIREIRARLVRVRPARTVVRLLDRISRARIAILWTQRLLRLETRLVQRARPRQKQRARPDSHHTQVAPGPTARTRRQARPRLVTFT